MGHQISAVVIAGDVDIERGRAFDVKTVPALDGFTLVAIDPNYVDFWAQKLDIHDDVADQPLLNSRVVHHIINEIAPDSSFAIIETEYFGGVGEQSAAAYRGGREIMAPQSAGAGVINAALRLLGVPRREGKDEFDSLGLGNHRDWNELFKAYWDR